jgi:hypothetical protein
MLSPARIGPGETEKTGAAFQPRRLFSPPAKAGWIFE